MIAGGSSQRITLSICALALAHAALSCGPAIPEHDGYSKKQPWKKAKVVKFDELREAEVDGTVNYAKRKRARWYAVDLPGDGELEIKFEYTRPLDREDSDFDVAFEVLNKDYKVISTANKDDEDANEATKSRTLYELRQGRYFIHVYLQGRMDKSDFSIKLKYKKGSAERLTDFPTNVDFPPKLAVVPAFDDAPSVDCSRCNCRRNAACKAGCDKCKRKRVNCRRCNCKRSCKWSCRSKCGISQPVHKDKDKDKDKENDKGGKPTSAKITRVMKAGGGTKIIINRGSRHGIEKGWHGSISGVARSGFTVSSVSSSECSGVVSGASYDAISKSKLKVYLRPPK